MHQPDSRPVTWRKSSYSTDQANCVEIAFDGPAVGVRDSKSPSTGSLLVRADRWRQFLDVIRAE